MLQTIKIKGARENNLRNIDVEIPRNKLVVFTGVSGSGKSSLAFGTLFAEGQRRFMESLSSYARQFLGQSSKPNVDDIEGLSPAISIDQKTTNHNPRSTVGTVTEIYDYLRLLYARVGVPHCPDCDKPITRQSVDQIAGQIFEKHASELVFIESPVVRGKKGTFEKEFESWKRQGFIRARVDGEVVLFDDIAISGGSMPDRPQDIGVKDLQLDKNVRHNISIIVDRVTVSEDESTRINEALETALRLSEGLVTIIKPEVERESASESRATTFSTKFACIDCGISLEELEPRSFSFNSPFGACGNCSGLGFTLEVDPKKIIPNMDLSLAEGAIIANGWNFESGKVAQVMLGAFAKNFKISLNTPIRKIPEDIVHKLLHGTDEKMRFEFKNWGDSHYGYSGRFEGVIGNLKRRYRETTSEFMRTEIGKLMINAPCPDCGGKKLRKEVLAVKVGGKNISEVTGLSIKNCVEFFETLIEHERGATLAIAEPIVKEVLTRLKFLVDVGLHYLTLARNADSLSGGESQRIRLATQIGSGLVGVLYILDEPSIGLHQRDNDRLLATLFKLRDLGNTLIVVEHDEDTIRSADFIVDIGPMAGRDGGQVVAVGSPAEIAKVGGSITGQYLSGERHIAAPTEYRVPQKGYLEIRGAYENNLKNIDVSIPLGILTAVTGVSGSGKSTLINRILYPALHNMLWSATRAVGKYSSMRGITPSGEETRVDKLLDKVIEINQSPIGRTPRSNPATYTGVLTPIRELFAGTKDAKERRFEMGRFSFNVRGGRCESCEGDGVKKIEMHFLPDIYVECEVCRGRKFNKETLEVKFKGKNIFDVLDMTVDDAAEFFEHIPSIFKKLKTLKDVGLGYIKLGQSSTTLSGGEAQRVKLATELSKTSTGKTIYILDEPTTGLSTFDVEKLIGILQRLASSGNTVVVIEHNLDVIKVCDHIIDLGPEGGDEGGRIVATGTPREVANAKGSETGRYLKKVLGA